MTSQELWERMMSDANKMRGVKILAELLEPITMQHYLGYWDDKGPVCAETSIPAGATVRVVMASRLGDLGITEHLKSKSGYGARVPREGHLMNIRIEQDETP